VGDPIIVLVKKYARIMFIVSGSATRITVENCAEESAMCAVEDILVPEKKRDPTDSSEILTDFTGNVELADSAAKTTQFKFWLYDGNELIHSNPTIVNIKKSGGTHRYFLFVFI